MVAFNWPLPKERDMRKLPGIILSIVMLLAAQIVMARGVGTSAANFLKIGQGARPSGMGGAFVGLADDINCLEWNPAGLTAMPPDFFDAAFEHVFWLGDVEYEMLSYAQNLGENYGAGLRFMYRHMPDIDNNLDDENRIKVSDYLGSLGYGLQISNFSIGVNLKFIVSQMDNEQLAGEAADLGMLISLMENKMAVGLSIQNLGPDIKSDSLPLNVRGGLGYKDTFGENKEHSFNASAEIDQPMDNKMSFKIGGEYWYMKTFAVRLGFNQQLGANDLQSDSMFQRMSVGSSICWADLQLDYAFTPYADLGVIHRLMLTLHYGPLTDKIEKF
jgi:hypothetical protein